MSNSAIARRIREIALELNQLGFEDQPEDRRRRERELLQELVSLTVFLATEGDGQ